MVRRLEPAPSVSTVTTVPGPLRIVVATRAVLTPPTVAERVPGLVTIRPVRSGGRRVRTSVRMPTGRHAIVTTATSREAGLTPATAPPTGVQPARCVIAP